MVEKQPFKLGVDHEKREVLLTTAGKDGAEITGRLSADDVSQLMAMLSHCQHVLVASSAGERLRLPVDPNIAFEPKAGRYALGLFDTIIRFSVGIDDAMGAVAMMVLAGSQRLSGYRISPDMARRLAQALVTAADRTPPPQAKS